MQTSDNFDLKIYEGSDLFNPLTVENDNIEAIDEQMFENQKAGAQVATELYSGGIHAITREVPDAAVFRFTAVSDYTAGETFTVDDTQVSAFLTSGEALPTGAFKIGSEVLCALKGSRLTVYMSRAKAESASVADGLKDGSDVREASYFATASALSTVSDAATGAGNLAAQAKNRADAVEGAVANIGTVYTGTQLTTQLGAKTTIMEIELDPGTYIMQGRVKFSSNGTGYRGIQISQYDASGTTASVTTPAVASAVTSVAYTMIAVVEETTTLKLAAFQTSGSTLTASGLVLQAVRIK